MSRIGKLPVTVPQGVAVTLKERTVRVKGPKGELARVWPDGVDIVQEGSLLRVIRSSEDRDVRAKHGLVRALVANMVNGVSKGFERKLEIEGVGFKGEVKGRTLQLALGFSHPVLFAIPEGISIDIDKGTKLVVKGADRDLVGETAAKICKIRPPDSYKGKGVRYEGQRIRLKAGKTAKK